VVGDGGERMYIYGGRDDFRVLGDLVQLDLRTMEWSKVAEFGFMPSVRYNAALVAS